MECDASLQAGQYTCKHMLICKKHITCQLEAVVQFISEERAFCKYLVGASCTPAQKNAGGLGFFNTGLTVAGSRFACGKTENSGGCTSCNMIDWTDRVGIVQEFSDEEEEEVDDDDNQYAEAAGGAAKRRRVIARRYQGYITEREYSPSLPERTLLDCTTMF